MALSPIKAAELAEEAQKYGPKAVRRGQRVIRAVREDSEDETRSGETGLIQWLMQGNWNVSLFHLDPWVCCLGCCCPCVLAAMNAQLVDENPWLYCCGIATFACPLMVPLRVKTRELFGIRDDVRNDAILSGPCCVMCSNCQVASEFKSREEGFGSFLNMFRRSAASVERSSS